MLPGLSIKILIHQLLQILRASKVISYQFLTLTEKMNSFHRYLLYSFTGTIFEHAYDHNYDKVAPFDFLIYLLPVPPKMDKFSEKL